ncbi:MAG: hypothetical protein R3288_01595 [Woeseiaceae bacterium]|nr:hypothetical protein [Woeseiaceae bacterium]
MTTTRGVLTLVLASLLPWSAAGAQAIETVYSLNFESTDAAAAAIGELFEDDDLRGSKVTLYAADFGVANGASHVIVADYDSYADRTRLDKKRTDSHGWARYMLKNQETELVSADLVTVVRDFGKPRHTAGYLVVFLMSVSDSAAYLEALGELDDAIGNPGVLRLVGVRTGSTQVSHAVLVGADSFEAANSYLDKLFASDAYAAFVAKVEDIRSIRHVEMFRRVGGWGY